MLRLLRRALVLAFPLVMAAGVSPALAGTPGINSPSGVNRNVAATVSPQTRTGIPATINSAAPRIPAKLTPYVVLYNVANQRCADIPNFGRGAAGQPVTQFACRPGTYDNQQMRIVPVGQFGRFLIQTRVNGTGANALCFDLPNYGRVPKGTRISLYHCRPYNDNQLFYLRQIGGAYQIVHNVTGMCLDVSGYRNRGLDVPLTLWPCSRNDDHMWWLRNPATTPVQPLPQPIVERCPEFHSWENKLGGVQVHASVSFRASDTCQGRHVRRAWVHVSRPNCRFVPGKDVWSYTSAASSAFDSTRRTAEAWLFDSLFPGCTTKTGYDVENF